jgi:hypothetical protein
MHACIHMRRVGAPYRHRSINMPHTISTHTHTHARKPCVSIKRTDVFTYAYANVTHTYMRVCRAGAPCRHGTLSTAEISILLQVTIRCVSFPSKSIFLLENYASCVHDDVCMSLTILCMSISIYVPFSSSTP